MTFISLYHQGSALLATSRLVFSHAEIAPLASLAEQAARLAALYDRQVANEREACDSARASGHREGYAAGLEDASMQQAERLVELERRYSEAEATLCETVIPLALEVVRRLAGEVAPADWLYGAARTAAESLRSSEGLRLCVAASQFDALTRRWRADRCAPFVDLVADDALAESRCVLKGHHGQVDIDLHRQLERLEALLVRQGQGR